MNKCVLSISSEVMTCQWLMIYSSMNKWIYKLLHFELWLLVENPKTTLIGPVVSFHLVFIINACIGINNDFTNRIILVTITYDLQNTFSQVPTWKPFKTWLCFVDASFVDSNKHVSLISELIFDDEINHANLGRVPTVPVWYHVLDSMLHQVYIKA